MFITNKLPETLAEETPVVWKSFKRQKQKGKFKQTFNFKAVTSKKPVTLDKKKHKLNQQRNLNTLLM